MAQRVSIWCCHCSVLGQWLGLLLWQGAQSVVWELHAVGATPPPKKKTGTGHYELRGNGLLCLYLLMENDKNF